MGGFGSGEHLRAKARPRRGHKTLDIRKLQRTGALTPGRISELHWSRKGKPTSSIQLRAEQDRLCLTHHRRLPDGSSKDETYSVAIEWTPCHYGGSRAWFHCPANGCGRRVAVLYGGAMFACRRCHQLAYESRKEEPHERALSRAQAIRTKLGGTPNVFANFPPKPKGMHWRTYERLRRATHDAESQSWPPWLRRHLYD